MQENTSPFENYVSDYENWFEKHPVTFQSELQVLKQLIPQDKKGIELGVGTGMFASKLHIAYGIDPSEKMLEMAKARNIKVKYGIAEDIPFPKENFDFVALITALCFISNTELAMQEIKRILKKEGELIIAIIDKESTLGKSIEHKKKESKFYAQAHLYSVEEVVYLLEKNGFSISNICQTLIQSDPKEIETPLQGHGKGGFVVIKAKLTPPL